MTDRHVLAIPDTDGEFLQWLDRLETLLEAVAGEVEDPANLRFDGISPSAYGWALEALHRLSAVIHEVEASQPVIFVAADGHFELIPLRFALVDRTDVAAVGNALGAIGLATLRDADDPVSMVLGGHAHRCRLGSAEFLAGCTRAHAVLDQLCEDDVAVLARTAWRWNGRVVLSEAEESAYERVTDEHLAVFHLNDPLLRLVYRGASRM